MIPKVLNKSNNQSFTSLFYMQELKNGKNVMKELSPKAEEKWLDLFLGSTIHKKPKYLKTDDEGYHYINEIGEPIVWDRIDDVDCLYFTTKDGKHRITALNDCEAKEGEEHNETIKELYEKLTKIFLPGA